MINNENEKYNQISFRKVLPTIADFALYRDLTFKNPLSKKKEIETLETFH
jgi:hypothetical protein